MTLRGCAEAIRQMVLTLKVKHMYFHTGIAEGYCMPGSRETKHGRGVEDVRAAGGSFQSPNLIRLGLFILTLYDSSIERPHHRRFRRLPLPFIYLILVYASRTLKYRRLSTFFPVACPRLEDLETSCLRHPLSRHQSRSHSSKQLRFIMFPASSYATEHN